MRFPRGERRELKRYRDGVDTGETYLSDWTNYPVKRVPLDYIASMAESLYDLAHANAPAPREVDAGDLVHELIAYGLTLAEIGDLAGASIRSVRRWKNEDTEPTGAHFRALSSAVKRRRRYMEAPGMSEASEQIYAQLIFTTRADDYKNSAGSGTVQQKSNRRRAGSSIEYVNGWRSRDSARQWVMKHLDAPGRAPQYLAVLIRSRDE